MVLSYVYIFTLLLSIVISQSQFLNQNRKLPSVTREENNLDDSITEIFNICKCVIFYMCDEENFLIPQDKLMVTRVASNEPMRNIFRIRCSNEYYYCCKNSTEVETRMVTRLRNIPPTPLKCGQSKFELSNRLIDEFPWMVAIYYKKNHDEFAFKCGGSLIHPRVVMTGQDCISAFTKGDLRISGGREFLAQNLKLSLVSKIIKHEAYSSGGQYNLALLLLQSPLSATTTICLPRPNEKFYGRRCTVVGWSGMTQSGSHKLKKTASSLIYPQRCEYLLRNSSQGQNFRLHPSYLCAEGSDSCRNDEGGPLMCQEDDGQYVQMGIVPFGSKCQLDNSPILYTNVQYLVSWISQKIVDENL